MSKNPVLYQVAPGMSADEVISKLGLPLKKAELDSGLKVMVYSSETPSLEDLFYIKDEKVLLVSRSEFGSKNTLKTLFPDFSQPEFLYNYRNPSRDTNASYTFLAWYSKGYAVVVSGNSSTDVVDRVLSFSPMSEAEFLKYWPQSKYLTNDSEVKFITDTTLEPSQSDTLQSISIFANAQIRNETVLLVITIIVAIIFAILLLRRRKSSHTDILQK